MSLLSDVIILGSDLETDEQLNCMNNWLQNKNHGCLIRFVDSAENKITKSKRDFTSFLAIGCFNFLNIEEFIKHLNDIEWVDPDTVKILIDSENGVDGYEVYKLEG